MRIGHGFDIHRFVADKPLVLGGVLIPYPQGMLAHSDGDVVLHAVCDALLGAAGLGDIGQHFSDQDPQYAGIDSRHLLRHVVALLHKKSFVVSNLDVTVIAEAPKLAPYIAKMREHIAADLATSVENINVKATTMEKLGHVGRGEAIEAHAVALLEKLHYANHQ